MSRGIWTSTRQFALQNTSAWHDSDIAVVNEICSLHCHLHEPRKNLWAGTLLSICVQSPGRCRAASPPVLLHCSEIKPSGREMRKQSAGACRDLLPRAFLLLLPASTKLLGSTTQTARTPDSSCIQQKFESGRSLAPREVWGHEHSTGLHKDQPCKPQKLHAEGVHFKIRWIWGWESNRDLE